MVFSIVYGEIIQPGKRFAADLRDRVKALRTKKKDPIKTLVRENNYYLSMIASSFFFFFISCLFFFRCFYDCIFISSLLCFTIFLTIPFWQEEFISLEPEAGNYFLSKT